MAKPAGVTAVTLPGDIEFSAGGVRTDHLIGAFVKSIDGNGQVVMQDAQGREFVYPTRLGSSPIAIFIGTDQPADERFGDPVDRARISGQVGRINQRFPFQYVPQQQEFGGENLGIEFLTSGDVPSNADLFGDEIAVPDGCVARVPAGLWDFEVGMHTSRHQDSVHATHILKILADTDDSVITDAGHYSNSGEGDRLTSVLLHYAAIRNTEESYYYLGGARIDSDDEAAASYYWLFRYLGV